MAALLRHPKYPPSSRGVLNGAARHPRGVSSTSEGFWRPPATLITEQLALRRRLTFTRSRLRPARYGRSARLPRTPWEGWEQAQQLPASWWALTEKATPHPLQVGLEGAHARLDVGELLGRAHDADVDRGLPGCHFATPA